MNLFSTFRGMMLLGAVCAASVVGACASSGSGTGMSGKPGAIKSLVGDWDLKRLGGADLASLIPQGSRVPSLTFAEDGGVSGFTGVNRLTSRLDLAKLSSGQFSLSPAATTRMAGPPEMMSIESQFTSLLGQASAFKVEGGSLSLLDQGKELLGFVRR